MSGFLWTAGHVGWGVFSIAVFSCVWALLTDLCWRLWSVRVSRLAIVMFLGWIVGACLIVLAFHVANR
ncbi:MAG: hypothetical protein ACRD27_05070 [Terracidiphilus sp.]